MRCLRICHLLTALAFLGLSGAQAAETTVLGAKSYWRCFSVRGSELTRTKTKELVHLYEFGASKYVKVKRNGKSVRQAVLNVVKEPSSTSLPPAGWMKPEFDDGGWAHSRGPLYGFEKRRGGYLSVKLLCARGRFEVKDPAGAKGLKLSVAYNGGVVVYVNGKELKRQHLPKGKLEPLTPAEDYPEDAFLTPDGLLLRFGYGDTKKYPERYAMRPRKLEVEVPASVLRKGVNVLAVEVHRAPAPESMFTGKTKRVHAKSTWWRRLALEKTELTAPAGAAVTANVARPKGLQVWNHSVIQRVADSDYGDPNQPLRPVKLTGVRNGVFSGQVVVGNTGPIGNLKIETGDLKGPGTIPASAVEIRYMLRDGGSPRSKKRWFYGLAESAPKEVAVVKEAGAALQPVWVTVRVPGDAKPGDYSGKVKLSAQGSKPVEVPVRLTVIDWKLPDSQEFGTHVGLIQSPETLAIKYGVPLWGEKHWKLIERSFKLLGQVGSKSIYLTPIRRTHFGNEHGMITWERGADGSLKPDLSIAEKYVATAVKHLGKIPVVGVYCWEPKTSPPHYPSSSGKRDISAGGNRDILISVKKDGKLEEATGPKWGTPECRKFWKPVMAGIRNILKKHGIEKSMMLGISCDWIPTKECMDDLTAAAPEVPWIAHSHVYWTKVRDRPVGYLASVWGLSGTRDPALPPTYYGHKRYYGWRKPFRVVAFPRAGCPVYEVVGNKPPELFRFLAEGGIVSAGKQNAKPPGVRGFGRLGADFWPVTKSVRSGRGIARGRARPICGRYTEALGGGMALTYVVYHVLSPGPDGALATDRFEMLREGLQEAEARIFIEKALLDEAKKAKLGEELAAKCQALLDERVRDFLHGAGQRNLVPADWLWYRGCGWQQRSRALYTLAAEVAAKLGGK